MGPVCEGSLAKALDGTTDPTSHLTNVIITSEFDGWDTVWRVLQMAGVGLAVVGTRTLEIEGIEAEGYAAKHKKVKVSKK